MIIKILKKNKGLFVYVFALYMGYIFLLAFQSEVPTLFNVIFVSVHLLASTYFILKFKKENEIKDDYYKEKLHLREQELQALFDNNNAYLWSIDLEKKTFLTSVGFENIFGYPREAFMNNYELWLERVIPEDFHLAQEHYNRVKTGHTSNQSWRFRNSREELKWLDAWGVPIFTNGEVTHITGVAYDITDQKRLEEELKYNATHDHLTGLPNRTVLNAYIEDELHKNKATPLNYAVLFVDLDSFKSVNDTYGHVVGDRVLIEAARRIKSAVGEKGLVTRHGGDEFVVLVPYNEDEKLVSLATKILQVLEIPFQIEGEQMISTSIGISMYPKDAKTLASLITLADQALYQAKSIGKNTYQFSDSCYDEKKLRKDKIENDLLTALKKDQFEVFYQPKVVLETNEIYGVEALLRWNHPDFKSILPDEFIPIAEAQGMIHTVGLWVLEEVMKQSKRWEAKGIHLTYAINISNIQFGNPQFLAKIQQMLLVEEVDPTTLIFEITETFMHTSTSNQSIKKLKALGIEVSIDDFGTGYSALSILSTQLVNEIKIDKSFIRNLTGEHGKAQIVKTILSLSDAFLSRTVAEGIETEEEAVILQKMGCLYGQGYLYSRPVKPEIIEQLLMSGKHPFGKRKNEENN